ncbi:hypothetical protein E2C01_054058 [Portunus trituberculatus]|uniref:CCHC-type domain-containing protein n=1 Tax=Portunus trituberculatus TaxID=210409 RepID=A0A5B7GTX9_PORTR|nr:hypothetical protein [Portunus trituberculatus]
MEGNKTEASSPPSVEELLSPPALQWPQETRTDIAENTSYKRLHRQDCQSGETQWILDQVKNMMQDQVKDMIRELREELREELRHQRTPNCMEGRQETQLPGQNGHRNVDLQKGKAASSILDRGMKETFTNLTQTLMPSFENGSCIEYWAFKTEFQSLVEERASMSHANAYEVIDAITDRFRGKLKDDYMDKTHERKKANPGAICGAEWLLTFMEDMIEKTEDSGSMREKEETRHRADHGRTVSFTRRTTGLAAITSSEKNSDRCTLCQRYHEIENCRVFLDMSTKDRIALLRRERRCFYCLQRGHWKRDCQHRIQCGIGGLRVATKAQSGRAGVITGTLLDSGSDSSYCTRSLADRSRSKGEPVAIIVGTIMNEGKEVTTEQLDLKVTGVGRRKSHYIPLCQTLVVPRMPSTLPSLMANPSDIANRPYLRDIAPPCIPGGVELLIGFDAPQALLPLEVKAGRNGEPFATRTLLGLDH